MSLRISYSIAALFLLGSSHIALAQAVRPTFYFGGGPSFPQNRLGDFLKTGYNLQAGGGIRTGRVIEFLGQFDYHDMSIKDEALTRLQVPGGSSRVYSVTGNIKLNLVPQSPETPLNFYGVGGGGWYRRTVEFTRPTTEFINVYDPFFGFVGTAAVPADQVIGSISRNAGGFSLGGGLEFRIGAGTRLYAEARWHRAYTTPTNTTMVPITVGLRF